MMHAAVESFGALALVVLAATYLRGWWRLRAIGHEPPRRALALYLLGLAVIAAALLGLDHLAGERFSVHMVQHLLLTMAAAPLLMLGNPLSPILWGLPAGARRTLAATLRPGHRVRRTLAALTAAPVAGVLYVATIWAWHVPFLYDAAADHDLVHVVEHAMFLGTAILFWWPVLEPAPRLRRRLHPGLQILYLLLATAQNTALGMALTLPERVFYPHYAALAQSLGTTALQDQALGGGLMWSMGHTYLLPILVILYRLSRDAEREPDGAVA
jgi:cytochrome c oxidase assembly factor CtaG